jgi:hypothetical protein
VSQAIDDRSDRAEALAALGRHFANGSTSSRGRTHLNDIWHRTVPVLATRVRSDLLKDIRALREALYALGGSQAASNTFRAIQDIGRWWQ